MTRAERSVAAGLVLMVVIAATYIVTGPARQTHDDISAQRALVAAQLATLRQSVDLQRQQLQVARETQALVRRGVGTTDELETLAREVLQTARSTDAKATDLTALSRQLLALATALRQIAAATERHAENLDRKVP